VHIRVGNQDNLLRLVLGLVQALGGNADRIVPDTPLESGHRGAYRWRGRTRTSAGRASTHRTGYVPGAWVRGRITAAACRNQTAREGDDLLCADRVGDNDVQSRSGGGTHGNAGECSWLRHSDTTQYSRSENYPP